MSDLKRMLKEWHAPYSVHELQDAEDLIHDMEVELAGKEAVIEHLKRKAQENDDGI